MPKEPESLLGERLLRRTRVEKIADRMFTREINRRIASAVQTDEQSIKHLARRCVYFAALYVDQFNASYSNMPTSTLGDIEDNQ